jgi:hypothetical protein
MKIYIYTESPECFLTCSSNMALGIVYVHWFFMYIFVFISIIESLHFHLLVVL